MARAIGDPGQSLKNLLLPQSGPINRTNGDRVGKTASGRLVKPRTSSESRASMEAEPTPVLGSTPVATEGIAGDRPATRDLSRPARGR
jgi:hypothetical protein